MNPLRYVAGEWTPVMIALLVVAVVILLVAAGIRRRERRGDWGPGLAGVTDEPGYMPADLRSTAAPRRVSDPHERWLLGLAAPLVEQSGLLHHRWSLVPAFCDDAWRRRLAVVAAEWGVTRARDWRRALAHVERQIDEHPTHARAVDLRPLLVTRLAMILRLGVAARHTGAPRARRRLEQIAGPLRRDYSDWLGYADAVIKGAEAVTPGRTTDLRADVRTLYANGGPWSHVRWES